MPHIIMYKVYKKTNDIRKDSVIFQIAHSRITYNQIKHAEKLCTKNDLTLYRLPKPRQNEAGFRYALIKGSHLTESKFTQCKNRYLKTNYYIGFMDIAHRIIKPKNVGKLDVSEVKFVYTSDKFRGKGYGKLIYDLVLRYEPFLLSGNTLHTDSFIHPSGSYYIWNNHISNKYNVYNLNTKTKKVESYKTSRSYHVRYIASRKPMEL